jgi:hypothetical protein
MRNRHSKKAIRMAKTKNKGKRGKTKQNMILVAVLLAVGIGLAFSATGCCDVETAPAQEPVDPLPEVEEPEDDIRIELYHFHGRAQCYSCIRLGELAEKTANTYFSEEMESGKLVFGHVNYDLPEGKELKEKYGVTGSSLWIGALIGNEFSKEQDIKVWYRLSDESDFMSYLKGVIEKRLKGELK